MNKDRQSGGKLPRLTGKEKLAQLIINNPTAPILYMVHSSTFFSHYDVEVAQPVKSPELEKMYLFDDNLLTCDQLIDYIEDNYDEIEQEEIEIEKYFYKEVILVELEGRL